MAAQLAGDRQEALRLVIEEGVEAGLAVSSVATGVIGEAQREIGRLWELNRISVADEHMATAISQLALSYLYRHATPAPALQRSVLVACVEGELHGFPARLAADALDLAGFAVTYLGENVPSRSLADMCRSRPPDLLALSATMGFHLSRVREATRCVREALAHPCPILVGGQAFPVGAVAADYGADGIGRSAEDIVAQACRLLSVAADRIKNNR